jgi:hypothetical protein
MVSVWLRQLGVGRWPGSRGVCLGLVCRAGTTGWWSHQHPESGRQRDDLDRCFRRRAGEQCDGGESDCCCTGRFVLVRGKMHLSATRLGSTRPERYASVIRLDSTPRIYVCACPAVASRLPGLIGGVTVLGQSSVTSDIGSSGSMASEPARIVADAPKVSLPVRRCRASSMPAAPPRRSSCCLRGPVLQATWESPSRRRRDHFWVGVEMELFSRRSAESLARR